MFYIIQCEQFISLKFGDFDVVTWNSASLIFIYGFKSDKI